MLSTEKNNNALSVEPPLWFLRKGCEKKYDNALKYMKAFVSDEIEDAEKSAFNLWQTFREATETDGEACEDVFNDIFLRYINGDDDTKALIENIFIALCGYSLSSLIEQSTGKEKKNA